MTSRLVLGSGSLAGALVHSLAERPGRLSVLAADENAVRALREEGVAAETGDPTDEAVLGERDPPETVAVATDDPEWNLAAARAVRRVFPDAFLLAYAGIDPTGDVSADLQAVADEVVDPGAETAGYLLERVGDAGIRTRTLTAVLRDIEGSLAVVTHDNPDPDAIASAVSLSRIAGHVGLDADVCYYGDISHQENRAFVNLLDLDLRNLQPEEGVEEYGGVALVDHSRPGVNDGLPEDTAVDVVIDHHPPRYPVEARFVDLRSDVGATSTLLVEYLRQLGITPSSEVATGLLFGIRVDTDAFTREVSSDDFDAAAYLQPRADFGMLERIESPSVSPETLDTVARAIANRERHGTVLVSGVGGLPDRDALAQAADRLLNLEDVTVTFVYGIDDGTVYVSARARGTDADLGETLRDAFGQIGSAGGHADMAGAQIPLGLLEDVDADDADLATVVRSVIADRFLEAVESHTRRVITDLYPDAFHGAGTDEDYGVGLPADIGEDATEDDTDGREDAEEDDTDGREDATEDDTDGREDATEGDTDATDTSDDSAAGGGDAGDAPGDDGAGDESGTHDDGDAREE